MATRSHARKVVLQMLYQQDLNPDIHAQVVRGMVEDQIREPNLRQFAWQLFVGVMEYRKALDSRIEATAENWKLSRMAPTDRNVLRLGAYELLHTDTPYQVVIDEAIELAKRFGTAQSAQFVNGILDRLVPQKRSADEKRSPDESGPEP